MVVVVVLVALWSLKEAFVEAVMLFDFDFEFFPKAKTYQQD